MDKLNQGSNLNGSEHVPSKDTLVVFLHGGPGLSHEYFLPLIEQLSNSAEVVTYTQGDVSKNINQWTLSALTEELRVFVQKFPQSQVVLVGHSFGSVIALNYAFYYQGIAGLFLMNWIYDNDWIRLFHEKKYEMSQVTKDLTLPNLLSIPPNERLKRRMLSFSEFYFDAMDLHNGQQMLSQINYRAEINESVERSWNSEVDAKKILNNLKIPIFSLTSASDRIVVREYYQNLLQLARFEHVEIEDGGHFLCYTRAALVAGYLKRFLSSLDSTN